ncbi:MAG: type II toxin-antitoxin system RelE/ParE family toxin [Gemmatimonadales bacterium]
MATQAIYYRGSDGSEPVAEFLDEEFPLEPRKKHPTDDEVAAAARKRATLDLQIDRLNGLPKDAPPLPFPHSSQVDGALRELRCHYGNQLVRSLYRRSDNLFVLLHALRKSGQKVPRADIEIAKERWHDFKARMDADPRKPPRATGDDAP